MKLLRKITLENATLTKTAFMVLAVPNGDGAKILKKELMAIKILTNSPPPLINPNLLMEKLLIKTTLENATPTMTAFMVLTAPNGDGANLDKLKRDIPQEELIPKNMRMFTNNPNLTDTRLPTSTNSSMSLTSKTKRNTDPITNNMSNISPIKNTRNTSPT